jgi:hypothetical protein
MYQLEVKAILVAVRFPQSEGWRVTVDVDAMERAEGGAHPDDKREKAQVAERQLRELGVTIGAHPRFGRADIVAEHTQLGTVVIGVEGDSSRQREQAVYSALGQALLVMRDFGESITYGIAVPDRDDWVRQLQKVPLAAAERLKLQLLAVSPQGVRQIAPNQSASA